MIDSGYCHVSIHILKRLYLNMRTLYYYRVEAGRNPECFMGELDGEK